MGYALDTDVKHIATLVLDEDRTRESRELVDQFVNTQTFRVVGEVHSVTELADAIRRGQAYVGLQIPPGFTRDLHAGRTARIQVLIDGSNSSIASSSLNTALNVGFRKAMLQLAARTGLRELPVEVRPQILYNPEMRSPNFFVPGVIGLVLQIATMFATAMSLVRERERGHAGAADGQPAVALGADAGQAHAVPVHLHGDGRRADRHHALGVQRADRRRHPGAAGGDLVLRLRAARAWACSSRPGRRTRCRRCRCA